MLRPSLFSRFAFLLLAPLVGALPAHAATYTATNLNDSGPGSFRAAVLAANQAPDLDTVDATNLFGTINLQTPLPSLEGQFIIKGPGSNQLVLRRGSSAGFNLFSINGGARVQISGLTLTAGGGGLETGGAIDNEGTLNLSNCIVTNNAARRGGGVYSTGSVTVDNCIFSGNSATGGGAISSNNGFLTVTNSTFSGNTSTDDGGALVLLHTLTSLKGSTFSNNLAGNRTNTADNPGWGGAIFAQAHFDLSSAGLTIENCTLASNNAGRGGALYTTGQTTEIRQATICDNSAAMGAGVWSEGNTVTLTFVGGTILAGNSASASAIGLDVETGSAKNTFSSRGYNLVGGGNAAAVFCKIGDKKGKSRQQLLLGALAFNGGTTQTLLPQASSPAIDAIPASALTVATDQRGKTRPIGSGGDIGSVEAESTAPSTTLVVNTPSDGGDGTCNATECTLREAINTANTLTASGSTQVSTITFAPQVFSSSQTITLLKPAAGAQNLTVSGKMKIVGPGANLLTVQIATASQSSSRLLNITSTGSVQISGLAFKGGRPALASGGAIYSEGALDLTDCVLQDNSADGYAGGAIFSIGQLSLLRCNVSNNTARGLFGSPQTYFGGGGIYNEGPLSIKDSTISNNKSVYYYSSSGGGGPTIVIYGTGGGICIRGANSPATLENSTIANNNSMKGGGIFAGSPKTLTILSSTVSGNTGYRFDYSDATLGTSSGNGSGIHAESPLVLRNSTVAENKAVVGLYWDAGSVWLGSPSTIENSTIMGKTQPPDSNQTWGSLVISGASVSIKNTVIATSQTTQTQDIFLRNNGTVVSGGYNFIGYGPNFIGLTFNGPGDREGGFSGPINATFVILDPHLGALTSNGGSVQTIPPLSDSPLINTGEPSFNTTNLPYDERGTGFPRVVGGRLDIGAVESSYAVSSAKPAAKPTTTPKPTTKSNSAGSS